MYLFVRKDIFLITQVMVDNPDFTPSQVGGLFTFLARQLAKPDNTLFVNRKLFDQVRNQILRGDICPFFALFCIKLPTFSAVLFIECLLPSSLEAFGSNPPWLKNKETKILMFVMDPKFWWWSRFCIIEFLVFGPFNQIFWAINWIFEFFMGWLFLKQGKARPKSYLFTFKSCIDELNELPSAQKW